MLFRSEDFNQRIIDDFHNELDFHNDDILALTDEFGNAVDNLDQTTSILFNKVVFNKEIPNRKFTFIPPPNTETFNAE